MSKKFPNTGPVEADPANCAAVFGGRASDYPQRTPCEVEEVRVPEKWFLGDMAAKLHREQPSDPVKLTVYFDVPLDVLGLELYALSGGPEQHGRLFYMGGNEFFWDVDNVDGSAHFIKDDVGCYSFTLKDVTAIFPAIQGVVDCDVEIIGDPFCKHEDMRFKIIPKIPQK